MKKLLLVATIVLSLGATVYAADTIYGYFTDQESFADWYEESAMKLYYNGVMNGYPDGSFGPENFVNRAELAVMFDNFAEKVVGKELQYDFACTASIETGLRIFLQDQYGDPVDGAVIMAGEHGPFHEGEGIYSGIEEQGGYFEVVIQKEGYATHRETVILEMGDCHVKRQTKTITLIKLEEGV